MKPFRFGVNVRHAQSRSEWAEKVRNPALVSAAEATRTLKVGTNVLNNDLRHPVLVEREAGALDLLTDGRFQLGLGAGSIQSEYALSNLGAAASGAKSGTAVLGKRLSATIRTRWL